jgi:hypothetical protein
VCVWWCAGFVDSNLSKGSWVGLHPEQGLKCSAVSFIFAWGLPSMALL